MQQQKTSPCTVRYNMTDFYSVHLQHLYCLYWQATTVGRKDVKIIKENFSVRKVEIFLSFVGSAWFLHKICISYKKFSSWKNVDGLDANSCQKWPNLEEIIRIGIWDSGDWVKVKKGWLTFIYRRASSIHGNFWEMRVQRTQRRQYMVS